jgi:hypothetical protein
MTSNKVETSAVHFFGREPKLLLLPLLNEYSWDKITTIRVGSNNYKEGEIMSWK